MDAKTAWLKLNSAYNPKPKPSEDLYQSFLRVIGRFSLLAIEDAYNHTIENEKWFPTIALFKDYCDVMQERIDDEEREKQKRIEKIAAQSGHVFGKDPLAKHVQNIVRELTRGTITRGQYVDKLKALGLNPDLTRWYEQQGCKLEGKSRISKLGRRVL